MRAGLFRAIAMAFLSVALTECASNGGSAFVQPAAHARDARAIAQSGSLSVTPGSLQFTALQQSASVTVSSQYATAITADATPSGVVALTPASADARDPDGGSSLKTATFTITATGGGTVTVTFTDKKGKSVAITVTVSLTRPFVVTDRARDAALRFEASSTSGVTAPSATMQAGKVGQSIAFDQQGALYVATGDSVSVYAKGATGGALPTRVIGGDRTGFYGTDGIAVDRAGYLYVADYQRVLVFAPGVGGNVPPVRSLTVGTGQIRAVAVDAAEALYLTIASGTTDTIAIFAPGASGSSTPSRSITSSSLQGLSVGLAVASSGIVYATTDIPYTTDHEVLAFAADADGPSTPVAELAGSQTQICGPWGIAVDAADNIWVAGDCAGVFNPGLSEFAPGATGNVAPLRHITKSAFLARPMAVAIDPSTGTVWDADFNLQAEAGFAPTADGSASAVAFLTSGNVGMTFPSGIVFDASGALYTANNYYGTISVYGAFAAGLAPVPARTIGAFPQFANASDIAVDASGTIYASTSAGSITVYGLSDNLNPTRTLASGLNDPQQLALSTDGTLYVANRGAGQVASFNTVTGAARTVISGLSAPGGLALDRTGTLYVAAGCCQPAISIFAPGASGSAVPLRTITATSVPFGYFERLAVDDTGNVYGVSDNFVAIFAPGSSGPTAPTRLVLRDTTQPGKWSAIALPRN